jgi:hypothetical protein
MEKIDGIEQHLQSSIGEHFDKCQTSFWLIKFLWNTDVWKGF